jgi:hypothetical protein
MKALQIKTTEKSETKHEKLFSSSFVYLKAVLIAQIIQWQVIRKMSKY